MKLHLDNSDQLHLIRSCIAKNNGFEVRIGEMSYENSLILSPEKLEMWEIDHVSELKIDDFERLAKLPSEVIILGTGKSIVFPSPALSKPLIEKGVGLEVMDTPAACRTFNILRGDGRKAVVALIL